jgi:glucosylglycerol-phosphate synthase
MLLLATDLDGTFLGGRQADRLALYRLVRARPALRLVFVTGRGVETVLPLLADPLIPDPEIIIGDVGATVVRGDTLESVQPLQSAIDARWPGERVILERLAGIPGLERQPVPQERRCSFHTTDEELVEAVRERVSGLGVDVLHSGGRYLDVLPSGVNKGSTLRSLMAHLEVEEDRVLVAGDTLNDLALYTAGFRGVVVGNAEGGLLEATASLPGAYHARRAGAGGILEALNRAGVVTPEEEEEIVPRRGDAQLVMVYHRLPYEEVREEGRTRRRGHTSPNGIIPTLLGFFREGRPGAWVAWSEQENRNPRPFEAHALVDPEAFPNLIASRIALTREDVDLFYRVFSKEALWPVIFSFIDRAVFREEHWEHYREINRIFAERAAAEADEGALVWIHDYNLWLVPAFLRQLRPDVRIAFFHHTAFPPPDIFNILPWRRELVGSLLQCDYVGFHIPRYVENFVDVVRAHAPVEVLEREACAPRFLTWGCALGVESAATRIRVGERELGVGAHPVGIDVQRIEEILAEPGMRDRVAHLREELGGRTVILSVERLDYVKGPLEKLEAYERFLEEHPELHGDVVLLSVATPPSRGMEIYREVQREVERAVGRINGRFSRLDWSPVRYLFRSLPFEEVLALYAVSDLAWITPLRDGLNLVAKEYVAARESTGRAGVLVVSEFAGVATELQGAVLTNPYDQREMAGTLFRSLMMLESERRDRMARMAAIVKRYDVAAWGDGFLEATGGLRGAEAASAEGVPEAANR